MSSEPTDAADDGANDGGESSPPSTRRERTHHARLNRRRERGQKVRGGVLAAVREFVVVVGTALVLSLVVKTWLIQAFFIPSGSMEDTLVRDDRVVINKLAPRFMDLERGDIVVFSDPGGWLNSAPRNEPGPVQKALIFIGLMPDQGNEHLIKRVIGLPGDRVACCTTDGHLTINGSSVAEPYLKKGDTASRIPFEITVPPGHLWVMGDHRSNSEDSRYHDPSGKGTEGSIPMTSVTGRAIALVWPFSRATWFDSQSSVFRAVPAPSASP